ESFRNDCHRGRDCTGEAPARSCADCPADRHHRDPGRNLNDEHSTISIVGSLYLASPSENGSERFPLLMKEGARGRLEASQPPLNLPLHKGEKAFSCFIVTARFMNYSVVSPS